MGRAETEYLARKNGVRLAFRRSPGAGPAFVWCSGFRSDMAGTKAEALHAWAEGAGVGFLRFDYAGHGESGGAFADQTLSDWLADAEAMLAQVAGPLVLVGSSMGGWIALLAALKALQRVQALLLIAPAPDFTEALMWSRMSAADREKLMTQGRIEEASEYSPEPNVITRALIEDGRRHLLLDRAIPFAGPVRILHGQRDPDVPWERSLLLAERLQSQDVCVTFVKDGDHRLSRPQDIALLISAAEALRNSAA